MFSKFNVGLKSRLHQGLSEPEFYGDLEFYGDKFKKNMDGTDFSDQFQNIIIRHKRIGYDLNVKRQSTCLVINPITFDNFAALFNCTPVDRASDSMMARPKAILFSRLGPELFRLLLGPPGLNWLSSFASDFQWWCLVVQGSPNCHASRVIVFASS